MGGVGGGIGQGYWDQGVGWEKAGGWGGCMGGWVGFGCVGGWTKGSHTSLDQPCLGLTWLVKGNSTLPPPPIRPLGSFVP